MADIASEINVKSEISGPVASALSFLGFALIHILLRPLTPASVLKSGAQTTWKWRNICNSLVHSILTGIWAMLSFYWHPKMAEDLIGTHSSSSHLLISVSVGYFIYDFIDMLLNHRKTQLIRVIICFGLSVLTQLYIGYSVVALLVEVNSIFLHTRQLMIIKGAPRQHSGYRLNALLNIGTFLIFRILTLGWMTRWLVVHREEVPVFAYTLGSVGLAVIVLMSIVLFFRILDADFISKKGRNKKE
uniref:TLC domain-containing protein n=1 Tax=Daphnia galeata TaxID=27404 RepID=A0A8J2WJ72_9CRUS|nr:unnamed protein product [Daphnia galeata]